MAEKKTSGFRFRLPWLLQPALPSAPLAPTQPPRTTTQKPPFRPPGKAPAPAPPPTAPPPSLATPAPLSPKRSTPQSVALPPPPPPSTVVSPVPLTTETIEPAATQTTTETQATTKTSGPAIPPPVLPSSPPRQAQSQPSPPQTPSPSVSPDSSVPSSPIARPEPLSPKQSPPQSVVLPPPPPPPLTVVSPVPLTAETIEPAATLPTTETQATTKTTGPAIPPPVPPSSPSRQAQSQPSPPKTPSPTLSPDSSVPSSPIARATEPAAAQPAKETQTTIETIPTRETAGSATPPTPPLRAPTQAHSPPSPPQTPSSSEQSPTHSPLRSPSGLASESTDKTSPPPKTTSEVSEIKRATGLTNENFPANSDYIPPGNYLALDEKSRERAEMRETQTKSMDSHSMDLKAAKPKVVTAKRVPLYREIKDGISRFIHEIATSPAKQSMDEKAASVVTIAGDNTGALMHLVPAEINRIHKLATDKTDHDAAINENGSPRRDSIASEDNETKAIVNSNIQGINNSMIINSSVNERDPGVHLGLYSNPANTNDLMMKSTKSTEMHRAEVNITPAQKVVYEQTMGRTHREATTEPSESEFEADEPETSGHGYEIEVL